MRAVDAEYAVAWEEPAPTPNSEAGSVLFKVLTDIQTRPNEWARVAVCKSMSGANSIRTGLKSGKRSRPEGSYSYTVRTDTPEQGMSTLYARYNGPDDTPDEPEADEAPRKGGRKPKAEADAAE